MHICMVSTGYYPIIPKRIGAIEPYVYGLSKSLALRNQVTVFGIGCGEEVTGNLHVKTLPYSPSIPKALNSIFGTRLAYQTPYNIYLSKAIADLNKKEPIDVLHIHDANSGFAATFGKLALNIPYVCSIHNEIRSSFTINSSNKLLAVSGYIRDFLIRTRGISPDKVDILDVAIDIETPDYSTPEAKSMLGLGSRKVLLYVGRKCPEKGPQVLMQALPEIVSAYPDIMAVFVGPDYDFMLGNNQSSYTSLLFNKAKELGVSNNILFKGFIPDNVLSLYYTAADVCVVPSIWQDPCPTVIKEALSYRKAVVASSIGGIPYLIKDGYNGLLVEHNNPAELANKVNSVLSNQAYATFLGENGRRDVNAKYSFDVVARACERFYFALDRCNN